jgi:F-type H+-transporting ATPase subunit beta
VPADDYTDPAPATTVRHLDSSIRLERYLTELGIYPSVDPLTSTRVSSTPTSSARSTYDVARETAARPPELPRPQDIIAIWASIELSEEQKITVRAGAPLAALHEPAHVRGRGLHRSTGRYVAIKDTVPSFKEILEGKADDLPEQAFFLAGTP